MFGGAKAQRTFEVTVVNTDVALPSLNLVDMWELI